MESGCPWATPGPCRGVLEHPMLVAMEAVGTAGPRHALATRMASTVRGTGRRLSPGQRRRLGGGVGDPEEPVLMPLVSTQHGWGFLTLPAEGGGFAVLWQ